MSREFSNQSDKAYWAWSYKHLQLIDREQPVSRECFNSGFYLGAQYAMHISGELSPHIAKFLEFVMWLTERSEPEPTAYQQELPLEEAQEEKLRRSSTYGKYPTFTET
jgi:hypothetical protein